MSDYVTRPFFSSFSTLDLYSTTMGAAKSKEFVTNEIQIQNAIVAYNTKYYCTINKATHAFKILYLTMKDYLSGAFSQIQAREIQQNLSNTKKKILI